MITIRDSNIGSELRLAVANGYGACANGAQPKDGVIQSTVGGLVFETGPNNLPTYGICCVCQ
jgi:hypothetical protein